tara:strand:+ start:132 stop:362 length:231 start_codon:yes stop_codon:yes gene_type:complete
MVYKVLYLSVGNNATLIIIGVNNSMKAIMELIEAYILRMTKRNASQLESVLDDLENLESDLVSLITDVKECIEGRI